MVEKYGCLKQILGQEPLTEKLNYLYSVEINSLFERTIQQEILSSLV